MAKQPTPDLGLDPAAQNPDADAKNLPGEDDRAADFGAEVPPLTGIVRVTALRTFYANDTFRVEVGRSVDLPAEAAQVHIDLEEARLADSEG